MLQINSKQECGFDHLKCHSSNRLLFLCRFAAGIRGSDPEGSVCVSPRPVVRSPSASYPPAESNPRYSSMNTTTTPPLYEPVFGRTEPLSPRRTSGFSLQSDKLSRRESTVTTENLHQDAPVDPGLNPSLDSDHGLITLALPSATWSSCPSPQWTTPHSGSGPKLTPSASLTRLESHHWPVLPPISPVGGEK